MKQQSIFDYINVDGFSSTPKYMQLANCIHEAVVTGKINQDRILPSLHELTYHLEISRDTADKGYKYLRSLGILASIPGKGHFITANNVVRQNKIFLLINELGNNKKVFYDAFNQVLKEPVTIDFYVYNNDFALFKKLLNGRREGYTHYVILPHFTEGGENVHELINTLPKDRLILLDKPISGVHGNYGAVYEDFKKGIYASLEKLLNPLSKYNTIKLVLPQNGCNAGDVVKNFNAFCLQYAFERSVVTHVIAEEIKEGEVYICLSDDDLITLIENVKATNLKVGRDIGIISCNETPLKKYIINGITTISIDFEQMGKRAANMILKGQMEQVELEYRINMRSSL
ncbi:substrate-binding domain-containing protein [Mucilaginibacter sp. AW1-3]